MKIQEIKQIKKDCESFDRAYFGIYGYQPHKQVVLALASVIINWKQNGEVVVDDRLRDLITGD